MNTLVGFYIHDSEYELLKLVNPEHILFQIYDHSQRSNITKYSSSQFALKTDSGILLRGPLNYYYGLAFRYEDGTNVTNGFFKNLNHCRISFFKTCIGALRSSKHIDVQNSISRRVLLGIMDSIRDYLLIIVNMYLQEQVGSKDMLYFFYTEQPTTL